MKEKYSTSTPRHHQQYQILKKKKKKKKKKQLLSETIHNHSKVHAIIASV